MNAEERRTQMLARIRPLIEEKGYDAVSVDAMARAAGVAKATFYRAFPAKETVRQALAAEGVAPERLDARDRREALLDAATAVFASEGYARATVDAIAAAAGMSKAGFYWHFESKEAIFTAVIARFAPFDTLASVIATAEAAGEDVAIVLRKALTVVLAELLPRRALFRVVFFELTMNPDLAHVFQYFIAGQALPVFGGYLERQMAVGTLRRTTPVLAILALIGPLYLYLFARDRIEDASGVAPSPEEAVGSIVQTFVEGNRVRSA